MDGKTVIGTKVVGGLNQPVIMESSPGFRMTRPPVVTVPNQIRMRAAPPNIMITPKMVGGKEVRLVTPSFPKPKPGRYVVYNFYQKFNLLLVAAQDS